MDDREAMNMKELTVAGEGALTAVAAIDAK